MLRIRSTRTATNVARLAAGLLRSAPETSARRVPAAALGIALLLAGCAAPRYVPLGPVPTFAVPTSVTVDSILAESADPAQELAALPRSAEPAIALRRAFLELELRNGLGALDATSQVLYGPRRPSANDEAFARYLRARSYALRGTPNLARYDLDRARELTMDPRLLARLEKENPAETRAPAALARVAIQPRSSWGAAAASPRNLDPMDTVTRITIHHSAMYFRDNRAAAAAGQLQSIQHQHMRGRGYGDIGYHFLVDPAGRIWQGRELGWQGAHASGANNVRNVGICLLGNFVRGGDGQRPTSAQVDALQHLVGALRADFGVPASRIFRHSDFKATQCPGAQMEPVMAMLRGELGAAQVASHE